MSVDLNLSVLRRQLQARKLVDENIHNLAKAMFTEGVKIEYCVRGKSFFGTIVMVDGIPGITRVLVRNLSTLKEREIDLSMITGLVKEN